MSLREPNRRASSNYTRAFLDQLHRDTSGTGRPAGSFTALCDRASIPRDLRTKLLDKLMSEKYVTREGDQVRLTPAGKLVATPPPPLADKPDTPSPSDTESRVRTPGTGRRFR